MPTLIKEQEADYAKHQVVACVPGHGFVFCPREELISKGAMVIKKRVREEYSEESIIFYI